MHGRLAPLLVVTLLAACAPAHDEGRPTNAPDQVTCTPPRIAPDVPRTLRSGGGERQYLLSVPDARTDEASPGVTRTTYDACTDDRQVALVAVSGGVHAWPGSVRADRPGNSAAAIGFSATGEVLSFFGDAGHAP